jgi:hypothetical protein
MVKSRYFRTAPYAPVPGEARAAGEFIDPPGCWGLASTAQSRRIDVIIWDFMIKYKECTSFERATIRSKLDRARHKYLSVEGQLFLRTGAINYGI